MIPVICIAGPTGCGKTGLALRLAKKLPCEIVNADSRQVYKDFPVITAQPTEEEKRSAPHYLYGFMETRQKLDAGAWCEYAVKLCRQIRQRGNIPVLVGGTGFYFKSLLEGLADIPSVPVEISKKYEKKIEEEGVEVWHYKLTEIDSVWAAKIHQHDRQRVQRAWEVFETTGKSLSWWHQHSQKKPLATGNLYLLQEELDALTPRLHRRIDVMLQNGAVLEAERAFSKTANLDLPGWSGIGCAELGEYLQKRISFEECKIKWLRNTRAYAKRQLTWFRGQKTAKIIKSVEDILQAEKNVAN